MRVSSASCCPAEIENIQSSSLQYQGTTHRFMTLFMTLQILLLSTSVIPKSTYKAYIHVLQQEKCSISFKEIPCDRHFMRIFMDLHPHAASNAALDFMIERYIIYIR